jgi:hypothetical protein
MREPHYVVSPPSSDIRDRDDRQLNAFAVAFSSINPDDDSSAQLVGNLREQVASFQQVLLSRGPGEEDILEDTGRLMQRISATQASYVPQNHSVPRAPLEPQRKNAPTPQQPVSPPENMAIPQVSILPPPPEPISPPAAVVPSAPVNLLPENKSGPQVLQVKPSVNENVEAPPPASDPIPLVTPTEPAAPPIAVPDMRQSAPDTALPSTSGAASMPL